MTNYRGVIHGRNEKERAEERSWDGGMEIESGGQEKQEEGGSSRLGQGEKRRVLFATILLCFSLFRLS